ncbi:MAG: hypothetical protein R3C19_08070 [Planctomycetaceae bacterium]
MSTYETPKQIPMTAIASMPGRVRRSAVVTALVLPPAGNFRRNPPLAGILWGVLAGIYLTMQSPLCAATEIDDILAAWDARAESVSSVHLKWTSIVTDLYFPDGPIRCPGEYAFDREGRYRFDLDNLSSDVRDMTRVYVKNSKRVYDGRRSVVLFGRSGRPDNYFPTAFIGEASPSFEGDFRIWPVLLLYQPLDKDHGIFQRSQLRLKDSEVVDGDTRCLVLTAGLLELWVTADEHYLPVRCVQKQSKTSDSASLEARVSYLRDVNESWYPGSWVLLRYGGDGETVIHSSDAIVESVAINETLPEELFQITEFEDGTWISESVNGERTVQIVRDGRPNRRVRRRVYRRQLRVSLQQRTTGASRQTC